MDGESVSIWVRVKNGSARAGGDKCTTGESSNEPTNNNNTTNT